MPSCFSKWWPEICAKPWLVTYFFLHSNTKWHQFLVGHLLHLPCGWDGGAVLPCVWGCAAYSSTCLAPGGVRRDLPGGPVTCTPTQTTGEIKSRYWPLTDHFRDKQTEAQRPSIINAIYKKNQVDTHAGCEIPFYVILSTQLLFSLLSAIVFPFILFLTVVVYLNEISRTDRRWPPGAA